MFVDRVKVFVKGGNGGNGVVSFRREKYIPHGGPDGGNGGDGGDVILIADKRRGTLVDLSYRPHLRAPMGRHGEGKNKHGKNAPPLTLEVPAGTVIKDEEGNLLADLTGHGQKAVVARGGRGGRGNTAFATARRRAPAFAEKGEEGEERTLILELKLLADAGMVGFPNAGKSTLLSRISAARPKIADYPFTTLIPQLGVVSLDRERSFVVADLPGIVEGAHRGVGLGHQFLRHIERTMVLIYVIDMAGMEGRDPVNDFINLREELVRYLPELLDRPAVIAANKMDIPAAAPNLSAFAAKLQGEAELFPLSAVTGEGVRPLLEAVYRLWQDQITACPAAADVLEQTIYLPPLPRREMTVRQEKGIYIVTGDEVERVVRRADLHGVEGRQYFQKMLNELGVEQALLQAGISEGDTVRIGGYEFIFYISEGT
ncbi:MAG: GTPase ObgE [Bacillota bacterium]